MSDYEPTAFFREITARLRGHIARFDINQADLAILCDVSQSQFSKIIRGARPMSIDQLIVICESMEIDIDDLVRSADDFINNRDLLPSPVRFVSEEERQLEPVVWKETMLDGWGRAALKRWDVAHPDEDESTVDLTREALTLAASDDDTAVDPNRGP